MISFDVGAHRFNLRAAAVFLENESVLLHRLEGDTIWALPGGRVEPGEDAGSALVREMAEEVDEVVHCGELLYVVENFFEHQSRPYHEIGLYFLAQLGSASALRAKGRIHFGVEGRSRLEFQWFLVSNLSTTNLQPSFLRTALSRPQLVFEHVVNRG